MTIGWFAALHEERNLCACPLSFVVTDTHAFSSACATDYSGTKTDMFVARSVFHTTEDTEVVNREHVYESTHKESLALWTRFTRTYLGAFYKVLEKPKRLYTLDDVNDYRPFMTHNTWSLERVFCRPSKSRYIAIVKGPGALTRAQFRSSFVCSLLGTFLIVFIFVSILVWFELSGVFVLLAFIVIVFIAYASLRNTLTLYKLHKDLVGIRTLKKEGKDEESENEQVVTENFNAVPQPVTSRDKTKSERAWEISGMEPSEAVYLVEEIKRITEPNEKFCYAMFVLEFIFLFLWPACTLFIISWNVAILFVIVASISAARHYINAAVLIEETGNMDLVGGASPKKKWRNKSRLNTIVTSITAGKTKKMWLSILGGTYLIRLGVLSLVSPTYIFHVLRCKQLLALPFSLFS